MTDREEKLNYKLDRALCMEKLKDEPAWKYIKDYLETRKFLYSSIMSIDDKDIEKSYLKHKIHYNIYQGIINLVESVWIKEGKRIKKFKGGKDA